MNALNIFSMYTVEFTERNGIVTAKSAGGIAPFDQAQLIKDGWIKKDDHTFQFVQPPEEEEEEESTPLD